VLVGVQNTKCGNFHVEDEEECDTGYGHTDPCCNYKCKLRHGAMCRCVCLHTHMLACILLQSHSMSSLIIFL